MHITYTIIVNNDCIVEIPEDKGEAEEDPRFGGAAMMVGNEGEDSVVLYLRMEERDEVSTTTIFDSSNYTNNIYNIIFII